jgi:hypothetical protein
VIGRPLERDLRLEEPSQRIGKRHAGRVADRDVEEAGCAWRRRRAPFRLPGVEADVVVVAACGDEGRLLAVALHQAEAEHIAVEGECTVDVRHLEMNVADVDPRVDRARPLGRALLEGFAHAN